jgi:hypothetical protein
VAGENGPIMVSGKGMLDAFIRIKSDTDIERFARKHGVLLLCVHGIPCSHNPVPMWTSQNANSEGEWCRPLQREPLERWHYFVQYVRAFVRIAAYLRSGKIAPEAEWEKIFEDPTKPSFIQIAKMIRVGSQRKGRHFEEKVVEQSKFFLAHLVNEWISVTGIKPHFSWGWREEQDGRYKEMPSVRLNSGTLGILAVQFMQSVLSAHHMYICSGCNTAYSREGRRMPQAGRRQFCLDCSVSEASRLRQQDYVSRRRAKSR